MSAFPFEPPREISGEQHRAGLPELRAKVKDAENAARDEMWAGYRFVALADGKAESGLRIIDLGAGHSSTNETLAGRVVTALKTEALLSETVGSGYLDRHWPPAFKESGAWPLTSLRQSFLNGSLTRLVDPDAVLRRKIVEFVESGSFGLASGANSDGGYERIWHAEPVAIEEVAFESDVFLLTRARSERIRSLGVREPAIPPVDIDRKDPLKDPDIPEKQEPTPVSDTAPVSLRISGTIPPELWNRLGTKLIPKLRSGDRLTVGVDLTVEVSQPAAEPLQADVQQILSDLNLAGQVTIQRFQSK